MKAVICGAGISGLTLAWWLARDGWEVRVVERAAGPRTAGYMIDFFGPGYAVAQRMGILPRLEERRYVVPDLIWVDRSGATVARLDYELVRRMLKGRLLNCMRGDLEQILYDALPAAVSVHFGCTVDRARNRPDGVDVALSDGSRDRVDLLVGADGIHSRVRELTFGSETAFLRPLGYQTAAYIFEDQRIREELRGDFRAMNTPGRQAGFYPISGGRVAAFFIHETPRQPRHDSPCDELRHEYEPMGWIIPAALAHCSAADVYFDQVAQVEMERWSRGRVALIGDACLAVSLLAGQGAAMGMASAYVLARELRLASQVDGALLAYEDRMRSAVSKAQSMGRRTAKWMVPHTQTSIAVRNFALRAFRAPGAAWLLARSNLLDTEQSLID